MPPNSTHNGISISNSRVQDAITQNIRSHVNMSFSSSDYCFHSNAHWMQFSAFVPPFISSCALWMDGQKSVWSGFALRFKFNRVNPVTFADRMLKARSWPTLFYSLKERLRYGEDMQWFESQKPETRRNCRNCLIANEWVRSHRSTSSSPFLVHYSWRRVVVGRGWENGAYCFLIGTCWTRQRWFHDDMAA